MKKIITLCLLGMVGTGSWAEAQDSQTPWFISGTSESSSNVERYVAQWEIKEEGNMLTVQLYKVLPTQPGQGEDDLWIDDQIQKCFFYGRRVEDKYVIEQGFQHDFAKEHLICNPSWATVEDDQMVLEYDTFGSKKIVFELLNDKTIVPSSSKVPLNSAQARVIAPSTEFEMGGLSALKTATYDLEPGGTVHYEMVNAEGELISPLSRDEIMKESDQSLWGDCRSFHVHATAAMSRIKAVTVLHADRQLIPLDRQGNPVLPKGNTLKKNQDMYEVTLTFGYVDGDMRFSFENTTLRAVLSAGSGKNRSQWSMEAQLPKGQLCKTVVESSYQLRSE
ncbi:MAG: hypothetical protein R3A11_08295 [Bdellovibrionota bacterium]